MAAEGTGDPSPRPRCPREQSSLRSDGRGFGIRGQRDADPSPHFSLTSLATPRFSLSLLAKERAQLPVFRHEALEPDQPASLSARRRDRTRRMRRRSCRCRRGPSAWRRVPAGCAWFPSHAPCGVSASPACSPPVVRARRVPTTSRADKVHGGDTHPPLPPPGTWHRPRLFWLLRVPRALWTGTSRSSAAKLQAEGRRCSRGSLPGASSAGGLLTWSRGHRSRAPVGAEDKPAARAL